MPKQTQDQFNKVYQPGSREEQKAIYTEWAETYDSSMADSGYVSPPRLAALLKNHAGTGAIVLDVGCGTGLSGAALAEAGFQTFDGIDIAEGMLAEAAAKDLYRRLFEADLEKGIPVEDGLYDAAFSTGVFTVGHVGPEQIPEVIRVVKTGGLFCLTVSDSAWEQHGYDAKLPGFAASGFDIVSDTVEDHVVSHGMQAHFPSRAGAGPEETLARVPSGCLRHRRKILRRRVVVACGIRVDLARHPKAGRRIQRSRHDRYPVLVMPPPEQVAAATAAETALRRLRRGKPGQGRALRYGQAVGGDLRCRGMMAGCLGALAAMAVNHVPERPAGGVGDTAAQARSGQDDGIVRHGCFSSSSKKAKARSSTLTRGGALSGTAGSSNALCGDRRLRPSSALS